MAGVYQIFNTETNKRYIGSSIDVERRLKEHKRNLKAHRHSNQHLQNAWNKYEEYLIFEPKEASRKLGIDKGGIKYALEYKEGYMNKLKCTFIRISKEEFWNNYEDN